MNIEVHTQQQLDKALKNKKPGDVIVCLGGTIWSPLIVSGSASVVARGSARVVARGSARVEARGSASVVARESASVVARESASVVARGSARVEASKYVPIQRHGTRAHVKGGVLIDVPDPSTLTPTDWCDYYGVTVKRGTAYLFKAVDDDLATSRARRAGIFYTPGSRPKCPDWNDRAECGGGLHMSPSPAMATSYNQGATRYVCCPVKLAEIVVIDDKVKVPRVFGAVFEVDRHGEEIVAS